MIFQHHFFQLNQLFSTSTLSKCCKCPTKPTNFDIKIFGKGAHGAMPEDSIDPIVCGSALVQAIQSLVSRNSDPKTTLVVSVTKFNSGHAYNVIHDYAELSGTIRYFDQETGKFIRKKKIHGLLLIQTN